MKILAITQARISSSRLDKKVLKKINNYTLLDIHLQRIKKSKLINQLIVATTYEDGVEDICNICINNFVNYYKGSTNNVLERFYEAAKDINPDYIVRLTSDCPLIDSDVIDNVINFAISNNLEYTTNSDPLSFPDGLDVEVMSFNSLKYAFHNAKLKSDLEHVTPFIRNNSTFYGGKLFRSLPFINKVDFSHFRITVDELKDFELIEHLVSVLGINQPWRTYIDYIIKHELYNINTHIIRNAGYKISLKND